MWLLRVCWVLLGTLGAGSAQLLFEKVTSVLIENGNSSVIIPCIITNLQLNNIQQMYVRWKLGGNAFFAFDGFSQRFPTKNSAFQSAEFVDVSKLPAGIASISLSRKEAVPGNYSCEVTESNREGMTTVELKKTEPAVRSQPHRPQRMEEEAEEEKEEEDAGERETEEEAAPAPEQGVSPAEQGAEIQEEQHAAPNMTTRKLLLLLRDEVRQINARLHAVEQRLDNLERAGQGPL